MNLLPLYALVQDRTLSTLARVCKSFKSDITALQDDQYYFYLRVQHLVHYKLLQRLDADWKQAYYSLVTYDQATRTDELFALHALVDEVDYTDTVLQCELATEVLLEANWLTNYYIEDINSRVLTVGSPRCIKLIAESEQLQLDLAASDQPTRTACIPIQEVSRILNNEETATANRLDLLFRQACSNGHTSVVSNMLKYIQDPSIVLRRAVRYEYVDIVKLIVSDPRTVKYVDRDLLVGCVAIREVDIQNTEIATLLERLKEAYFAR